MEPLFFKAENSSEGAELYRGEIASMEPLFFKAENGRHGQREQSGPVRASMEPLFFKAENDFAASCPPTVTA